MHRGIDRSFAGLLAGRRATTHHVAYDELAAIGDDAGDGARIDVARGWRIVRSSEKLWTSAGVSAGIDLALEAVDALAGHRLRAAVEDEMEWGAPWTFAARRAAHGASHGATHVWPTHRPHEAPRSGGLHGSAGDEHPGRPHNLR